MKWEGVYAGLDKTRLEEWARSESCHAALNNFNDAWDPQSLAMVYNHEGDENRRWCVWFMGAEPHNSPSRGDFYVWSGPVPDQSCTSAWLHSVLAEVQHFPTAEAIVYKTSNPQNEAALQAFKRRWPLIYGADYHHKWLVEFLKDVDALPITKPKKFGSGYQTQFGADLDAARTFLHGLEDDTALLEKAAKYSP